MLFGIQKNEVGEPLVDQEFNHTHKELFVGGIEKDDL